MWSFLWKKHHNGTAWPQTNNLQTDKKAVEKSRLSKSLYYIFVHVHAVHSSVFHKTFLRDTNPGKEWHKSLLSTILQLLSYLSSGLGKLLDNVVVLSSTYLLSGPPLLNVRWTSLSIIYRLLQLVKTQDVSKLDSLFDRACCDPEQISRLHNVIRDTFTVTAFWNSTIPWPWFRVPFLAYVSWRMDNYDL